MLPATPEKLRLLPPSPSNPRNSEGSFVKLADGRLLLVYSRFYGGARDDSPSLLAGRFSSDLGRTWTEDITVVENVGLNTMSASLLRLHSGGLALFYLLRRRTAGAQQCLDVLMRLSTDEARTWSEPVLCSAPPSYYVVNNDRVIQLRGGRLVIPTADHGHFDGKNIGVGRAKCFLSDDEGKSWRPSAPVPMPAGQENQHLQEPGIIELRDGRIMMLCRTVLGSQYRSYSADGGETWTTAAPTELLSPCSPASLKRLPATGDILLVYNDHRGIPDSLRGKRTPLVTTISRDEGQTWEHRRVLEDDPDGWYCYTAIHAEHDLVVLGYCAGNSQIGGLNLLQVTRVPVSWLYGG